MSGSHRAIHTPINYGVFFLEGSFVRLEQVGELLDLYDD